MSELLPNTNKKPGKKSFVVVTKDHAGLGFAHMIKDAGYQVLYAPKMEKEEEEVTEFNLVGEGMFPKMDLDKLMKARAKLKDWYWIFDGNCHSDESELLRKEGFRVFGGMQLTCDMEHDRAFGTKIVQKAKIETPPTHEFSDVESGMEFLDQNPDKAFVFKPDDGKGAFTTYVPDAAKPDKANRELYDYLQATDGDTGTYILQERKDGTEVNIELWLYKGEPFLAYANFECKRKSNKDEGEMVGCAQDIGFIVPIDCNLVKNTVAKLLPQFDGYTGFLDCNIIVADRDHYFLEFCARFGYNAHPNLFMNLALRPFPDIMADWMDGKIENFEENFKHGFGATITLRIDHPKTGYPIHFPEDDGSKFFYFFDQYEQDEKYYLAGYGTEVGIVGAHGNTIQQAAEMCIKNVDKINYPCHDCRTDLDRKDYETSPQLRLEALQAMRAFDRN